jgi:hypothetical protein
LFNSGLDFCSYVTVSATQIIVTVPSYESSGTSDSFILQPNSGANVSTPIFTVT